VWPSGHGEGSMIGVMPGLNNPYLQVGLDMVLQHNNRNFGCLVPTKQGLTGLFGVYEHGGGAKVVTEQGNPHRNRQEMAAEHGCLLAIGIAARSPAVRHRSVDRWREKESDTSHSASGIFGVI